MNIVKKYISSFSLSNPKHYDEIVPMIKEGKSSFQIRNYLVEKKKLSRLAAGMIVDDIERKLKYMKTLFWGGLVFTVSGLFFLAMNQLDISTLVVLSIGLPQLYVSIKDWNYYRKI